MIWMCFAISVFISLDALGAGISYHKEIKRISFQSKGMISLVSAATMWISLMIGKGMAAAVPETVMTILSACILSIIGLFYIKKSLFCDNNVKCPIGMSSSLEMIEASMFAVALSMDTFAVGIAVSHMHISWAMLSFVTGFMQILFLVLGSILRQKIYVSKVFSEKVLGVITGLFLLGFAGLRLW